MGVSRVYGERGVPRGMRLGGGDGWRGRVRVWGWLFFNAGYSSIGWVVMQYTRYFGRASSYAETICYLDV